MNRKIALSAFVAILSLSIIMGQFVDVASANFFPPAIPSPAIIIKSDGSIEPSTAPIHRVSDVYTLKDNIAGYAIVIQRNNIVVDGAGYVLQGTGNSTGIFLQDTQNVVIKNLTIKGFSRGVWFTWGLSIDQGAKNNIITNNTITNNTYGINCALFTSNNTIIENSITNNEYGIYIAYSPNNLLRNNRLSGNRYNLWVDCLLSNQGSAFINDIDASNTVDGKPVYYWAGEKDKTVPSDAGYVALVRCFNITVQGLNLSQNGQGVLMVETNNSMVTGNYIAENNYGIALFGMYAPCTNNTVANNRMIENIKNIYTYLDGSTNTIEDTTSETQTPPLSPIVTENPSPSPSATSSSSPAPTLSPSPSIPELPSWMVVPLILASALLIIFLRRRNRR